MRNFSILMGFFGLSALLPACGDEGEDLPSGATLSGTWTLPEDTWLLGASSQSGRYDTTGSPLCNVVFDGSTGHATCEFGIAGTTSDGEVRFERQFSLEVTIELRETSISAEGTWTQHGELDDGDVYAVDCSMTFSGSASRSEGRESEGRFSALAGKWEGTANTQGRCETTRETSDLGSAWQFDADLFGEQGTAKISPLGSLFQNTWVLQNGPQGVVIGQFGTEYSVLADEVQ